VTATRIAEVVSRGDLDAATANQIARKEYRTEYRQAVVQAADDDVVNVEQIGSVVQRTEFLEQTKAANARQLISVAGSQGIKLIDDLDDAVLRQLTDFQPNAVDASRLQRVVDSVEGLEDTRQKRAIQLISDASDNAGITLIDEIDDSSLTALLDYDGASAPAVRQRTAEYTAKGFISADEAGRFARDLQRVSEEGVDGVTGPDGAVADDFLPSSSSVAVSSGTWQNAKGAVFEVRTVVNRIERGLSVRKVGKEFELPAYSKFTDLSDEKINEIIDSIPWQEGTTRQKKLTTIKSVLSRSQNPGSKPELDLYMANGDYIEVKHKPKSGLKGTEDINDIQQKAIRYRVGQAFDRIDEGDIKLQLSKTTELGDNLQSLIEDTEGITVVEKKPFGEKA
jgi:hypothetical protein